jgi:hypothetical protein
MRLFADIHDAHSLDGESEISTLNDRAQATGWKVLHPGDSITLDDDSSRSIVISGVTWSKPDLEVLDDLASRATSDTKVWFFNPDRVFPDERILPGASRMVQTPAMAEYSGKRLVAFAQGGSVIDRIRNLFPRRS